MAYAADSIKLLSCRKPYYEIDLDGYIREYAPNMSESGIESLKTRLLDSGFNYDESSNMWTISRANIEGRDEEDNSMHLGLQ